MAVGNVLETTDSMKDYDYVIVSCWFRTTSGGNRGFKIVNTKQSITSDAGEESVYINGGIYYSPSYYGCIGLIVKADTKGFICGEVNMAGYDSLWIGEILGIKY